MYTTLYRRVFCNLGLTSVVHYRRLCTSIIVASPWRNEQKQAQKYCIAVYPVWKFPEEDFQKNLEANPQSVCGRGLIVQRCCLQLEHPLAVALVVLRILNDPCQRDHTHKGLCVAWQKKILELEKLVTVNWVNQFLSLMKKVLNQEKQMTSCVP